jgi:hypothetical protein
LLPSCSNAIVIGGVRVTKGITKCVLSNSICKTQHMSSTNNNDYHYTEREKNVLELQLMINVRLLTTLQRSLGCHFETLASF